MENSITLNKSFPQVYICTLCFAFLITVSKDLPLGMLFHSEQDIPGNNLISDYDILM